MGINHEKLTYRYSGRDYRLTDVSGRVVTDILALSFCLRKTFLNDAPNSRCRPRETRGSSAMKSCSLSRTDLNAGHGA